MRSRKIRELILAKQPKLRGGYSINAFGTTSLSILANVSHTIMAGTHSSDGSHFIVVEYERNTQADTDGRTKKNYAGCSEMWR